jgi:CBS domain-containing protein
MSDLAGFAAVVDDIDAATDEPRLRAALARAREAAVVALTAHTPALMLAGAWSDVMIHALAVAARLVTIEPIPWTWFVSGSVGRAEAIPGSDIETLISLDDLVDHDQKSTAMVLAADVHAALERCGLNPDGNGVLASRGRFCRRRSNWSDGIERWSAEPAEDRGVVMTGLLSDCVAVSARDDGLRARTLDATRRYPQALRAMLQDATAIRGQIPSRLRVFAAHVNAVDVKAAAVEPVVKIARWAAMSAGSDAVFTLERLDHAAAAGTLDPDDAATLRECYAALSHIRWRHRAGPWIDGERVTDVISLSELSPQERATLRAAGREVNGIRRKLAFLASTPSFR